MTQSAVTEAPSSTQSSSTKRASRRPSAPPGEKHQFFRVIQGYLDEAAKLIDFLLNDPDAIATLGITLGGPASDQATKILRETVNATQMKVLDYLVALRENALPGTPIWAGGHGELEATLGRLNQSVGFGQMKPAEAAAEMVSEGKRIIG